MVGEQQAPRRADQLWTHVRLFRGLSDDDLEAIAERLTPRPIAAGEVLVQQGVPSDGLFIVRTGVVEVFVEGTAEGTPREAALSRLATGECFGEMSLLTGTPASATVRALTDGEVAVLSRDTFLRLIETWPELLRNVSTILSERLLQTNRLQLSLEPAEVVVVVGAPPAMTRALAAAVARLAALPTLFVEGNADPVAGDGGRAFALADLLGGRLRPPVPGAAGELTVVRAPATEAHDSGAPDLSTALGRLAGDYRYVLVALPFDHPALMPHLLAHAARILVTGRAEDLPGLRTRLAGLPAPETTRGAVGILLVDAPARLRPTAATLQLLSEELGAPVRTILPATSPGDTAEAALPLARWLVKRRIGLALGAGGAKGYAHLGALRVLRRAGIPLDAITGTSIGACVGGCAATGMTVEQAEWVVLGAPKVVLRPGVPLYGVSGSQGIAARLRDERAFGERRIEDLPIPFAASAADLTEGREIVLRRGALWRAVLASMAIPGIYPPVQIGRHWLVDGGVVNPVPVGTARLLGADLVIAVDLSDPLKPRQEPAPGRPSSARPPLLFANILRAREIMMSEIRAHTVGEPSVLIKPRVDGLWNYGEAERFIAAGEEAAEAILPELREQLPWLGQS